MKFITAQQFKDTNITELTKFSLLVNKNILPSKPVCAQCATPLKYLVSSSFPEKLCYYCSGCNEKFNLKFRSIYKDSSISLRQIILLAEMQLQEKNDQNYLNFREKAFELQLPLPYEIQRPKKPNLTAPKNIKTQIIYEDLNDKLKKQKQYELDQRLNLLKQQKMMEVGLKIRRGEKQVDKSLKFPNEKQQKYVIRIPVIDMDSERMKIQDNYNPGPGQYKINEKSNSISEIRINKVEKEQKTKILNPAPYYQYNDYCNNYAVPLINNSPNRQLSKFRNTIGPQTYSPCKESLQNKQGNIQLNKSERFMKQKSNDNDVVSPAYYGVDWDKVKVTKKQNPRAVVNSYDRYLHDQNINSLIRNFIK